MLRSRMIRPGIATNEVLASLGPYAEILFTRLWMLADREGRLEDRPLRIKAEGMPFYEIDVEDLLKSLSKAGFILRYRVHGVPYIAIFAFKKHQPVHPHEAQSVIPPPSVRTRKHTNSQSGKSVSNVITSNGDAATCHGIVTVTSTKESVVKEGGSGGKPAVSTTMRKTQTPKPKQPPTREQNVQSPPRKPPGQQRAFPHSPEDVSFVRDSLAKLGEKVHLPPPDDGIVDQVLDAFPGATGEQVHCLLVALWKGQRFRNMYSWGLVPLIVRQSVSLVS